MSTLPNTENMYSTASITKKKQTKLSTMSYSLSPSCYVQVMSCRYFYDSPAKLSRQEFTANVYVISSI